MSDTSIVKTIFEYFAKFPLQAGVLKIFKRTTSPDQDYTDFKNDIINLAEHSIIPSITDFVFGTSRKFVDEVIRSIKGKYMYIEYAQATTTENQPGSQKDTKMFLSVTVAYRFSNQNYDVAQETLKMDEILDDIIAIETKILADSKAGKCYFARLMDFPIYRLPMIP